MLIGKRIKDLRIEKGLSQQELGDMIGVTKVSICGYENGTRIPSLESFGLLADVFGTTTDYLLGIERKQNIDFSGLTEEEISALLMLIKAMKK